MNFFALFCNLVFFLLYSLTHICMHKYASMCTCTCTYHTYVFNCLECVLGHFIFTLPVERVSADPRIPLSRSCTRARTTDDPRQVRSVNCHTFTSFFSPFILAF